MDIAKERGVDIKQILAHNLRSASTLFDGDIPAHANKSTLVGEIEPKLDITKLHQTSTLATHVVVDVMSKILLLTSACEPPSLVDSEPRYLKDVTVGSSASTSFTVVSVSFVGLGKYSVFVLLIFSPCLSNTTLHVSRSSSTSSRVIAHSTRSSANIIAQGGSFSMFSVRTSIIIMNKRGLRADP